jgi:hypothetical protein
VVVCWPVLQSGTGWGVQDWDQHFFYYESPRRTILEFAQFPLWNPWYCGGNPAFANPQFPGLTLSFLLTLPLGVPLGLKVAATLHAFIGMAGAWLLARAHGVDRLSAMLAGLLPMASTVYTLHVAAGHTIWFPTAYLPWAMWLYVRSRDDLRWAPATGIVLVAVALHGQLYFVLYGSLLLAVWAAIDTAARRDVRPLIAVAISGGACAVLGAVKWIPLAELFRAGGRAFQLHDRSSVGWKFLAGALLSRTQPLESHVPGLPWSWWEYGAYVGVVPMLLALVGLATRRRGMWTAFALAALALWVAAGWEAGLWPLVQRLPIGAGARVPSRVILFTVSFIGLLAAAGLGLVREKLTARGWPSLGRAAAITAVVAIAADLAAVSRPALSEAFSVEKAAVNSPVPFEQVFAARRFASRTGVTMYPYLLENRGVVNCYERFRLPPHAIPKTYPDGRAFAPYRGEAYVVGWGVARIAAFTPNRMEVEYDAPAASTLVLNQNYFPGWWADRERAFAHGGLVATPVPAGRGRVIFSYRPASVLVGTVVSAGGAAAFLVLMLACRFRKG